ncbi:ribonuclease H-like domain-containing protein [Multifurca ochricompacta]|uniref:Ribonuclease H-like domain-containing protein n=1 Tax=Multifurca ochricompacta TaxID=376703 RepID=A0AAD4M251_9AGAM|nr:ribonuclease H-like domain-containing protein [Multifurca ochricompacta]
MIRVITIMAASTVKPFSKFRAELFSGKRGEASLPSDKSASSARVLSTSLGTYRSTTDFKPDEDGVIDLTTPEKDKPSEAITVQVKGRRNPGANSASSSGCTENRRLKKDDSFKENKSVTKRTPSLSNRETNAPSTLASRSAFTRYQSPAMVTKPQPVIPVPQYPLYNYADNIPRPKAIYIKDEEHANEMVASLNGAVGLDLEWPFSSNRVGGVKEGKVALVQLCDADIILLIQVSKMQRFPQKVKELIESSRVPKTGVNIRNDGMKLYRDYGLLASNLIELGALACQVDEKFASMFRRPIVSLAKMVSYCLHKTLDKGPVRTSDWSKDLTLEQMKYASNDVHSGLMIFKSLMRTARSSKTPLIPERYTADLAIELRQRGGNVIKRTDKDTSIVATPLPGAKLSHRHAYTLWRQGHGLLDICIRMRDKNDPQNETVVISHILRVLTEDPTLPFSMEELISLIRLDSASWIYHRETIERWAEEGRGTDPVAGV